jgi:hypothetical protein
MACINCCCLKLLLDSQAKLSSFGKLYLIKHIASSVQNLFQLVTYRSSYSNYQLVYYVSVALTKNLSLFSSVQHINTQNLRTELANRN